MKYFLVCIICILLSTTNINSVAYAAQPQKPQTEKVSPKTDQNPIVGEVTVGGKTYKVRQGSKGGLYYWKQKASGEHKGEWYKVYVKSDKLRK